MTANTGIFTCRLCGEPVRPLLDFGDQTLNDPLWITPCPPAGRRTHPLRLDVCLACGFIQISDPVPPELIYPEAAMEVTSWKKLPQTSWQVDTIKANLPSEAAIIEIGCNDGHFLAALREGGIARLAGIEPSRIYARLAKDKGFDVREGFAVPAIAEQLVRDYGRFDLLAAKHVFGHIPDLANFFMAVDMLLKPDGKLFLEVPDFGMMLQSADCSLVYEKLVSYFTEETLRFALSGYGYEVRLVKRFPSNGGLLEILAERRNSLRKRPLLPVPAELGTLSARAHGYAELLKTRLDAARRQERRIFVFGGGMRSASLLNCFGLAEKVTVILDDNPAKQGLYFPGCGLPILAPETIVDGGRKIFLLAVSNENESAVTERIGKLFGKDSLCVSILGPADRDKELEKLSAV